MKKRYSFSKILEKDDVFSWISHFLKNYISSGPSDRVSAMNRKVVYCIWEIDKYLTNDSYQKHDFL